MSQSEFQNRLLRKLSRPDFTEIFPHMQRVELKLKTEILTKGEVIDFVYFPEDSVISFIAKTAHSQGIEVGMAGFEGMSNMVVRAGDLSSLTAMVQVAGSAWRIAAKDFASLLRAQTSLNEIVLRYKEASSIQFAYTAFANGDFTIEERLARWLLMSHDRSRNETIPVVHEFLAMMLAVRRAGITTATHALEGIGAIRAHRGEITIRDRDKLLDAAGESYGEPEAEYERLMSY